MSKSKNRPNHKKKAEARIRKKKETYNQKVNKLRKIIEDNKKRLKESEENLLIDDSE